MNTTELWSALGQFRVTNNGWRKLGLHIAILSASIKVGCFMMVKRALETAAPEEDGEFSGASWLGEAIVTCRNTGSTHLPNEYPLQHNNKGL